MLSKNKDAVVYAYTKGYRCDNDGNVISPVSGKKLSLIYNKKGYFEFGFRNRDGKKKNIPVSYLQAFCKYGEQSLYAEIISHKNGDSFDNAYDNIVLTTKANLNKIIGERTKDNNATMFDKYDAYAILEYYNLVNKDVQKTIEHFNLGSKFLLGKLLKGVDPEGDY